MSGPARDGPRQSVAIVVVNWNGYGETAACLSALEELDYPEYRVIVVDNGSTDGSGERLAAEFDWCEFIFNDDNRGFGGGCNPGIEAALSAGADYVLLLNNDARITGDAMSELVSVGRRSDAKVVGATLTHGDGTVVNPVPCRYPDMLYYSGYRTSLPLVSEPLVEDADARWFESARFEGAGVLVAGDLLRERREAVGYYLDDALFMYCEEIELAMWCRERGEPIVVATDAVVEHARGASSNRAFQLYYLTRNRVLVAHRYLRGAERAAFDVTYPTTRFALAVRWLRDGNPAISRAILEGLVDGYRHRRGRVK